MAEPTLENLLREDRTFPPPAAFSEQANAGDAAVYDQAENRLHVQKALMALTMGEQ